MTGVYCTKCNTFMRCETMGVVVEERRPGNQPYKLWSADKYQCPLCGDTVVTKFAKNPIAEHFNDRYEPYKSSAKELFQEIT